MCLHEAGWNQGGRIQQVIFLIPVCIYIYIYIYIYIFFKESCCDPVYVCVSVCMCVCICVCVCVCHQPVSLTAVSPRNSPIFGGMSLVITGENFDAGLLTVVIRTSNTMVPCNITQGYVSGIFTAFSKTFCSLSHSQYSSCCNRTTKLR